jgi:hypothetical protein
MYVSLMAYKNLEARRAWFRRGYRCRHEWELARAANYRQANREVLAERQREWIRQKFEADPTPPIQNRLPDRLEEAVSTCQGLSHLSQFLTRNSRK